jgi:hypothetical protein
MGKDRNDWRTPNMSRKAVLVALTTTLLMACATSPTGRTQLMLVSEETANAWCMAGAAAAAALGPEMEPYYKAPGKRPTHAVSTVSALN